MEETHWPHVRETHEVEKEGKYDGGSSDVLDVFASFAALQQKTTEEIIAGFINKQRESKSL